MLHYEVFEATVKSVSGEQYDEWKHLLPAVPVAFRHRFMNTVKSGCSITKSFDMVMMSQRLHDAEYAQYLEQALQPKQSFAALAD
jgi:hypothetical protein